MIKVILLIDCASEFDRRLLRGLVRYSKESGDWLFYRMPSYLIGRRDEEGAKTIASWAKKWKADAIIGRWAFQDTSELEKLGIPVVLQNIQSRSDSFSNLTGDYIGTGKLAANFFIKRGFRNLAYFGVKKSIWSDERLQGFKSVASEYDFDVKELVVGVKDEHNYKMIGKWAAELTKPAAVFVCDDSHAITVVESCKMAGIQIPEDITLLGVDNDELLCEISDPPISSIALDVEQGGYELCRALHRKILTKDSTPFNISIPPGAIVQRASTRSHGIHDSIIEKLVSYIDENFTNDISTAEILEQYPLSRRSIELKFKKEMGGTTIYRYITHCRVARFAQYLTTTDLPLSEIATLCGISDYSNFSRVFKKITGCSPAEYRKNNKTHEDL